MPSSGVLRHMALIRIDVSEEHITSETSVLARATLCNIPEDAILHSHCHENLKSYMPIVVHYYDVVVFCFLGDVLY
jgi:hypothetical protein